jgi:hypothetical protein
MGQSKAGVLQFSAGLELFKAGEQQFIASMGPVRAGVEQYRPCSTTPQQVTPLHLNGRYKLIIITPII